MLRMPNHRLNLLVCLRLPMKDPCCVLLSFAHTEVLDGRKKHPDWWCPLIKNSENCFKKRDWTFNGMRFNNENCIVVIIPASGVGHFLAT